MSKVMTVSAEVMYYLYKAGQLELYERVGLPTSSHILTSNRMRGEWEICEHSLAFLYLPRNG